MHLPSTMQRQPVHAYVSKAGAWQRKLAQEGQRALLIQDVPHPDWPYRQVHVDACLHSRRQRSPSSSSAPTNATALYACAWQSMSGLQGATRLVLQVVVHVARADHVAQQHHARRRALECHACAPPRPSAWPYTSCRPRTTYLEVCDSSACSAASMAPTGRCILKKPGAHGRLQLHEPPCALQALHKQRCPAP